MFILVEQQVFVGQHILFVVDQQTTDLIYFVLFLVNFCVFCVNYYYFSLLLVIFSQTTGVFFTHLSRELMKKCYVSVLISVVKLSFNKMNS